MNLSPFLFHALYSGVELLTVTTLLLLTVSPRSETVVSVRFQSELLNWLITRSLAWLVCLGDLLEFSVWERSRWIVFKTKLKNYYATCMVYIVNAKAVHAALVLWFHWLSSPLFFPICFTHLFIVSTIVPHWLFHIDWCCALMAVLVNIQHSFHQLHTACRQYDSLVIASQCIAFILLYYLNS